MFKTKAAKRADKLRALGYLVFVVTSYASKDIRIIAEKDGFRHVATYSGRKLTGLTSSEKHVWRDITSYQEIPCNSFVKDFS